MLASKDDFEKAIEGLPFHEVDLTAEVITVEPVDAEYFRTDKRQRCLIRRKNGSIYWSWYD